MYNIKDTYRRAMRDIEKEWITKRELAYSFLHDLTIHANEDDANWLLDILLREHQDVVLLMIEWLETMKAVDFLWEWKVVGNPDHPPDPYCFQNKLTKLYQLYSNNGKVKVREAKGTLCGS